MLFRSPALEAALEALRPGGVLSAILYSGKVSGSDEKTEIRQWMRSRPLKQCTALVLSLIHIYLADCPDLGPVLMVLGLLCEGTTVIRKAERLRIKESDLSLIHIYGPRPRWCCGCRRCPE